MEKNMNKWVYQIKDYIDKDQYNGLSEQTIDFSYDLSKVICQMPMFKLSEDEIKLLESIMHIDDLYYVVYWLSFMANFTKCEELYIDLVEYVLINKDKFIAESQLYLFLQIRTIGFSHSYEMPEYLIPKWDKWLLEIVTNYRVTLSDNLLKVKSDERNNNLVFVVTSQFLGKKHSPTLVAIEWCKFLIAQGKSVLLINTAENLTQVGMVPFWNTEANYYEPYSQQSVFVDEGIRIPFFQCPNIMPNIEILRSLLHIVSTEKPAYIISLGDIIFSDLADKIVPVYSVNLLSEMPRSFTSYRIALRDLSYSDREWLRWANYSEESVIRGVPSFTLPLQREKYTRAEFKIPDDRFCVIVVGNRLNDELTNSFLMTLIDLIRDDGVFICFVGNFDYDYLINQYTILKDNTIWIEYADDLLAVMELADLYVNPKRNGGGTSALFALHHGKPVVTTKYGDVSLVAGNDFCVDNLEGIRDAVAQYISNPEYYEKMSNIAFSRARELSGMNNSFMIQYTELEKKVHLES